MNKRQKKKLYKKICNRYGILYSSFPYNRSNNTLSKRENKAIKRMLQDVIVITTAYTKIRNINANLGLPAYTNINEVNSLYNEFFINGRLDQKEMEDIK